MLWKLNLLKQLKQEKKKEKTERTQKLLIKTNHTDCLKQNNVRTARRLYRLSKPKLTFTKTSAPNPNSPNE